MPTFLNFAPLQKILPRPWAHLSSYLVEVPYKCFDWMNIHICDNCKYGVTKFTPSSVWCNNVSHWPQRKHLEMENSAQRGSLSNNFYKARDSTRNLLSQSKGHWQLIYCCWNCCFFSPGSIRYPPWYPRPSSPGSNNQLLINLLLSCLSKMTENCVAHL